MNHFLADLIVMTKENIVATITEKVEPNNILGIFHSRITSRTINGKNRTYIKLRKNLFVPRVNQRIAKKEQKRQKLVS